MTTAVSTSEIQEAIQATTQLQNELQSLYQNVQSRIQDLAGTDFIGDGADGYLEFFNTKITPGLRDNLVADDGSILAALKNILQSIQDQLISSVDPALGQNNRSI